MAVAPKPDRTASTALPWLPLPAVLAFALFGLGGSVFLAYSTFSLADAKPAAPPSNEKPVYEARAVPFDKLEDPAQRAASISRALSATQIDVRRAETAEPQGQSDTAQQMLLADSDQQPRGFNAFGNFAGANTYLTITGTTSGLSAQTAPSGFVAPDAEAFVSAPIPEASTWMCGAALFVLVAARGARAHWHRKHRRD